MTVTHKTDACPSTAQDSPAALPAAWLEAEEPWEGHPSPGAWGPLATALSNPERAVGRGSDAGFQGRELELAMALVKLNGLKIPPLFLLPNSHCPSLQGRVAAPGPP